MNKEILPNSDGTDFSTKEDDMLLEYIVNLLQTEKTIKDVFTQRGGNIYQVKELEDSQILQGHLKGKPLVPGVLLKELFLHHNNKKIKENTNIKVSFHKPILPGYNIQIKEDGIYDVDDNLVMSFHIESNDLKIDLELNSKDMIGTTPATEEELDAFLLQTGKFRFVSGCKISFRENPENLHKGVQMLGFYKVPKDFPYTDKAENVKYNSEDEVELPNVVNPNLLDEFAAQLGSFAISGDMKSNEEKGNIVTFKSSTFCLTDTKLKTGDTFYLVGEITELTRREIRFTYIGKNQYNEEIIRGEIAGNIVPKKLLKRIK